MMDFLTSVGVQLLLAVILDRIFGEVSKWHPLVGFGNCAKGVERFFYPKSAESEYQKFFLSGFLALAVAITPFVVLSWLLVGCSSLGWLLEVFVLYFAIGGNSLIEHARNISRPLQQGNLEEAREKVGWIVSRETSQLSEEQVTRATIESVLENGNDAVFGVIFWFVVAGAPGVVLYRLANTLDAMWGYKNERYLFFGRAAARLDDILNWIPARLVAITYALQGNWKEGIRCWLFQAKHYKSPNGGAVMAAGAGCLGFTLGGKAVYHGKQVEGTVLGSGRQPTIEDIERSINLVSRGTWYWVGTGLLMSLLV